MSKENIQTKELLGALPAGVLINFLLGVLAIFLTVIFNGPRINIPFWLALAIFLILLIFYFTICLNCILALPRDKYGKELIKGGPYRLARHPMYMAIIFLLNPALALILRSWLVLLFIIPIFFIWKFLTKREENDLIKKFGQEYLLYQKETASLFPNLLKINKKIFFIFWSIVFIFLALIIFNFQVFKENFVAWDVDYKVNVIKEQIETKKGDIKTAFKAFTKSAYDSSQDNFYATIFSLPAGASSASGNELSGQNPIYNSDKSRSEYLNNNPIYNFRIQTDKTNQVEISKLNISAPLVWPATASKKDLDHALNQGVIIYPGSVMPPEFGNLFLTGHSSVYFWNKSPYGEIFANLNKLTSGDEIAIYLDGYIYKYRVIDEEIKDADDVSLVQYTNKHILTLMTCWPTGSSSKRLIVRAELIMAQ